MLKGQAGLVALLPSVGEHSLTGDWSQMRVRLCPQGIRDRTRGNSLKLCMGRFRLDIRENFFTKRVCQAVAQAAQSSVGVTIPGSIQKRADVAPGNMG